MQKIQASYVCTDELKGNMFLDTLSRGQSESEQMAQTRTLPSLPQAFQKDWKRLNLTEGWLKWWRTLVQGLLCVIRTPASLRRLKACKGLW